MGCAGVSVSRALVCCTVTSGSHDSSGSRFGHSFWQGAAGTIIGAVLGLIGGVLAGNTVVRVDVLGGAAPTVTVPAPVQTFTVPAAAQPKVSRKPGTSGAQAIERHDPLTLSDTFGADLDSDARNWDVKENCDEKCDLWVSGELIPGRGGDAGIASVSSAAPPIKDTCAAATAYDSSVSLPGLEPNKQFCVRTTEGTFALLRLAKVLMSSDGESVHQLVFDVTVWRK
jgi:hypothetical protein